MHAIKRIISMIHAVSFIQELGALCYTTVQSQRFLTLLCGVLVTSRTPYRVIVTSEGSEIWTKAMRFISIFVAVTKGHKPKNSYKNRRLRSIYTSHYIDSRILL